MLITELLVPLSGSDAEVADKTRDVGELVANLQAQGFDPTIIGVETTAAGDVVMIEIGGDDHDPRAA
jgi:hypothetical protein